MGWSVKRKEVNGHCTTNVSKCAELQNYLAKEKNGKGNLNLPLFSSASESVWCPPRWLDGSSVGRSLLKFGWINLFLVNSIRSLSTNTQNVKLDRFCCVTVLWMAHHYEPHRKVCNKKDIFCGMIKMKF